METIKNSIRRIVWYILETDMVITKNYLSKKELEDLERIVNAKKKY